MLQQGHEPEAADRLVLADLQKTADATPIQEAQKATKLSYPAVSPGLPITFVDEQVHVGPNQRSTGQEEHTKRLDDLRQEMTHSLSVKHRKGLKETMEVLQRPCSSPTSQSGCAEEEPEQARLVQCQDLQRWDQAPPHQAAGGAPGVEDTPRSFFDSLSAILQPRGLPLWAFANCTPVLVPRNLALGHDQAICTDGSGALVLVGLESRSLSLLQFSAEQGPGGFTKIIGGGIPAWTCKKLLAITEVLPLATRPQAEAAIMQVGSDTVLLLGELPDLETRNPARLVVHSLSQAQRNQLVENANGVVGDGDERPYAVPFGELSSWPHSREEIAPRVRSFYGVATDEARRAIVLFGGAGPVEGQNGSETSAQRGDKKSFLPPTWYTLDDLWSFSMSSCQWVHHFRKTQVPIGSHPLRVESKQKEQPLSPWPRAVAGHSAATWERNMWVFGGFTRPHTDVGVTPEGCAINDLWCLLLDEGTWRQVHASGKAPLPRYRHASCIIRGTLLVFGGLGTDGPVSMADTLYAAEITDPPTATWTRVTILDALPPAQFYLGAALAHEEKSPTDPGGFLLYGGREAYVISANTLKLTPKAYRTRGCGGQHEIQAEVSKLVQESPSGDTQQKTEEDERFGRQQNGARERHGECSTGLLSSSPAKVAWADTESHTRKEEPLLPRVSRPHSRKGSNESQSELGKHQSHDGLQILATPMPGAAQPGLDVNSVRNALPMGVLPHVREPVTEVAFEEKPPVWRTASALHRTAAPIVFRARRTSRRRTAKGLGQGIKQKEGHRAASANHLSTPPAKEQFLLQSNPAPFRPQSVAQQQGHARVGAGELNCRTREIDVRLEEAFRSRTEASQPVPVPPPPPSPTDVFVTLPTTAQAPPPMGEPRRPLSHQQLSILLSLSHQATIGSMKNLGGTGACPGVWGGKSSSADGVPWSLRPLSVTAPRSAHRLATPSPLPYSRPLVQTSQSRIASCHPRDEMCKEAPNVLKHHTQPLNTGGVCANLEASNANKSEVRRLAAGQQPEGLAVQAVETAHPHLCRLSSLASKHPSASPSSFPPLKEAIPRTPQRGINGVDALMWWIASSSSVSRDTRTANAVTGSSSSKDRSQSCLSARTTNSNSPSGSTEINRARETVADSRSSSDSDLVFMDRCPSPMPPQMPVARWMRPSQERAQFLAGMLYSSQLPGAPARYSPNGKKPLPPLPTHVAPSSIASSPPRSMVARRVAPFAFAAQSVGGQDDSVLPLPRPARRIKPSTSKIRQTSNSKHKSKNGGAPKAKPVEHLSSKPTPRQVQHRQPQRLHKASTPTPRTGRTKSIGQENLTFPLDMALAVSSKRKVNRAHGDDMSFGSALRKASAKSHSGRKIRTPSLPSNAMVACQTSHERLLRRMVGWPGEAIASLLLGKTASLSEPLHRPRTSSVKSRNLQKK